MDKAPYRYSARILYRVRTIIKLLDELPPNAMVGPTDWGGFEVHAGRYLYGHILTVNGKTVLDRCQSPIVRCVPCHNPDCTDGTIDSGGTDPAGHTIYLPCPDCRGLGWTPELRGESV